jgi:lipid-A-disaccharide synthase
VSLTIGIVAGEASGDTLGAALIEAVRERVPDVRFVGIAGPRMAAQGCTAWASAGELSVMGLTEILRDLPRLWRLSRSIERQFLGAQLDAFVGIDSPEFNLRMARRLKRAGVPTVQYVSPQVWAWRQGRVRTIGEACDLILCLLPFETEFYAQHAVKAVFVGHPLADRIPLDVDRAAARRALGLPADATILAVLPGSRVHEVAHLGGDFAAAAAWLAARRPGLVCVAPMASTRVRALFERSWAERAGALPVTLLDGDAERALIAADLALVASGTATLEAALCKRPMVVAYRFGALTAFVARQLGVVKVRHFSLPNLLAGEALVPEYFQDDVSGAGLGAALGALLDSPQRTADMVREFEAIHRRLRVDGARLAADAVIGLVEERRR